MRKDQKRLFAVLEVWEGKARERVARRIEKGYLDGNDILLVHWDTHIYGHRYEAQIDLFKSQLKRTNEKLGAITLERAVLLGKYDIKDLIP